MVICIYDNRPDCEIGVRLLLESLVRHSPNCAIHAYFAPASDDLKRWASRFPNLSLILHDFGPLHWNVKPLVLIEEFRRSDDVVWLDSDMIVTGPIEPIFSDLVSDQIVIAEDAAWSGFDPANKAVGWGLPVGRSFDFTLNTCVLRFTKRHADLLNDWSLLLRDQRYIAAQSASHIGRASHLFGDQDVLMALLSSKKYADVPLEILRRGKDILQAFGPKGFTVRERVMALRKIPTFIHAQGQKPWRRERAKSFRDYIEISYLDVSPLAIVANRGVNRIEANTALGRLLRFAGFGSVAISGLPLAILFDFLFAIVGVLKGSRQHEPPLKSHTPL